MRQEGSRNLVFPAQEVVAEKQHVWGRFTATATVLITMGAGQEGIDMSPWVHFEKTLLQSSMKKFKTFRPPQPPCYWRLIGDDTDEETLFTKFSDGLSRTVKEFHFLRTIDITRFSEVENPVPVKKRHRRFDT